MSSTLPQAITPSTTELAIDGMTCASCAARVTSALRRVEGVRSAHVNLATELAVVEHLPDVELADLTRAVTEAGYQARAAAADPAAEEDADAREREAALRRRRRLLILGIALAAPTMVLGMAVGPFDGKDWLMLALTLPVWAIVGWEFHRSALAGLRHLSANMDTLVSLGSTAALAYSVAATALMLPSYYETASAIIVLISIGKYLEIVMRAKSNTAIRGMLHLRPQRAEVIDAAGTTRAVSVDALHVGDIAIVRAGERIPVDGIVVAGDSAVDASMVTGESMPSMVGPGSTVIGGTLNGDGLLQVRATVVGSGTMLSRIVKAVRDAQGSQAPAQRLADRVAGIFVPAILIVALATFAGWAFAHHPLTQALMVAVAVVVVACPCAMGLATPTAVMAGVGVAARQGILFKNAEAMEAAGAATDVIFDKTGTLTLGHPAVTAIAPAPGHSERDLLAIAAAAEASSTHPIAQAIVALARDRGVTAPAATDAKTARGRGASAMVEGARALAGSAEFLKEAGVDVSPIDGRASVHVALGGDVIGSISIADPIRPESARAVGDLRALGVAVALVSGDAAGPVNSVADALEIADRRDRMLPEDKRDFVRSLGRQGRRTIFVGDGINDAPALAEAAVGIAMGGGTDIAIESADAAIVSDDPRGVSRAIAISRKTMRTIRQNLVWAFFYNIILVPLAAFGFVHPILAAGAMGASSLFVVGNSLLLARAKPS